MSPNRPKTRIAIVGGGISGIAQGIRIKEAVGDRVELTIIEKAGSPGGIWRDSKWPGAGVDIPIHLYSLYSDLKPDWNRVYATQPEVLEYWNDLIERHDLQNNFLFDTTYVSSTWSHQDQTHTLTLQHTVTKEQRHQTVDILISANGPLCRPTIPNIPGLEAFKGVHFHNLRWDSSVEFENKRVAVIGIGSSAIQFIPGLSEIPGTKVTQFIRSGGYFFPKVNVEYTRLQKFAYRWLPGLIRYYRFRLFLDHNKRWTARNYVDGKGHDQLEDQLLDYLAKNAPPEYLDALTPRYPLGCKRPAFDQGWLASLHKPNVHLTSSPIERITADGIVTKDGLETPVDIIVFATGSDVARHGVGLNVGLYGEDGLELRSYWESLDGPEAYFGLAVPKFPNYFMVLGPNALAGSWGYTIGNQTAVIARIIKEMLAFGLSSIQPKEPVFHSHNAALQNKLQQSTMASNLCTSWWRINGGKVTVANSLDGIELWKETRCTRWHDWTAFAWSAAGGKQHLREVDVEQLESRQTRKRRSLVAATIVLSGILLYSFKPRSLVAFFE